MALKNNTKLEALSLTNVGLTDRTALMLAEAVEKNSTLRVLNTETNFISPQVVVVLVKALLQNMSVEEFRASNQVSWIIETLIASQQGMMATIRLHLLWLFS